MSKENLMFHPIISSIQRIALYETKARFYLIGSNNTETRFRVLKIDRTDPRELVLVDDKVEYNKKEIHQLLNMIGLGNRGTKTLGLNKLVSAFGIVGFVRFLEGYYIVLVTKRRKVAVIGAHSIYKIVDTATIYIPSDASRPLHPDEQRYLRMFMGIDLSTNFYYSYSYDITHTLQMNMAPPRKLARALFPRPVTAAMHRSNLDSGAGEERCTCHEEVDDEDIFETWKSQLEQRMSKPGQERVQLVYGVRAVPAWRFVWNSHLLAPAHAHLHPDWILHAVHGFVEQSNLNIFGRPVLVTLIARRSNRYAGTRFLKRGANMWGDVANEVETEQIVHDSMVTSFERGRFSSFVQLRGSVPSFWSQDISKMVPKPAIAIDLGDPSAEVPARHVNGLLRRYGAPVMILNLVKKREKRKHESLLTEVLCEAVKYLNQFLPPEFAIQYYHLDMARANKGADAKVLDKLTAIARAAVRRTGVFLSGAPDVAGGAAGAAAAAAGAAGAQGGAVQTGVVRVNCVDCLDRTNTAQFAIGKCVLGYQLYALGLAATPVLEFDSDCARLLETLYEDHGDTLALQYGGSQLVHRIKTYRKTAPWSSHGNDIMQTLSRYYSNTFSDAEKQSTINLFLGLFVPDAARPPIWDYTTDYYLHHPEAMVYVPRRWSLTKWYDDDVLRHLPRAADEARKLCCEIVGVQPAAAAEMVDAFRDYYRPFEYTVLAEAFEFKFTQFTRQMCNTLRDYAPAFTENYSPFVVRSRPPPARPAPARDARDDSDTNSATSSDDEPASSAPSSRQDSPPAPPRAPAAVAAAEPGRRDLLLYHRYVNMERKSNPHYKSTGMIKLTVSSALSIDSSRHVIPPTVSRASRDVYRDYVKQAFSPPSMDTLKLYRSYVNFGV